MQTTAGTFFLHNCSVFSPWGEHPSTPTPALPLATLVLRSAEAFNLQQVSDGVHGCVQFGANGPDIHRCWSECQWRIPPWGDHSDSKATACVSCMRSAVWVIFHSTDNAAAHQVHQTIAVQTMHYDDMAPCDGAQCRRKPKWASPRNCSN